MPGSEEDSSVLEDKGEIRVAEVLQRLREEVRRQRTMNVSLPTQGGPVDLEKVRATKWVNPHLPIAWPTWPPGIWPKLVALAQKVTRRLLRWYINPIVEQQNAFNDAVFNALERIVAQEVAMQQRLDHELEKISARLSTEREASETDWRREIEETSMRLGRLERLLRRSPETVDAADFGSPAAAEERPTEDVAYQGLDYFRLESRFRPPSLLKERQDRLP